MIPSSEHDDILKQIHCGHLGIQKSQLRARDTIYWPGISQTIENIVSNQEMCLKFSANNRKQSPHGTLGHEIPTIPWYKLTMDIFSFDNNNYLVVVDYTSKFPLIRRLLSMTAWAVTKMLKSIFAEYGLLTCIICDNGPCYALEYFATEIHKLRIQHIITSLCHHQSNGLAKVYIKITKCILQKAKDTNGDPHLAMMVYWTTPPGPDQWSPMEMLHGHKAWSDLPLANAALKTKGLIQTAVESTKNQQNNDKNQLKEDQPVMFKTPPEKNLEKACSPQILWTYIIQNMCWRQHCIHIQTRFHLKLYTPQSAQATSLPMQAPTYCRSSRTIQVPKWMDL